MNKDFSVQCLRSSKVYDTKQEAIDALKTIQSSDGSIVLARYKDSTGEIKTLIAPNCNLDGISDPDLKAANYTIYDPDSITLVEVNGSGNAITSAVASNGKLTLKKDTSFATSSALTSGLAGKANTNHTHTGANITGLTASRALASDASGHVTVSAVTATELGYLDGVTSNIQTQLNGKAASIHTHTGSDIKGLTESTALIADEDGNVASSTISTTELGYLDGVTSNIQTQLNNKAGKSTTLSGYGITDGVNAVSVTGSGNAVTAASVKGHTLTLTKGTSYAASNHTHKTTDIASLTASRAMVTDTSGHMSASAVTATELGYLDGVTSSIQTQLNNKAGKSTSLSGYGIADGVNAVSVTGSGNAVTTASVSGHTLTLTRGASYATSSELSSLKNRVTSVENIEIGGRNLALNSEFKNNSYNGWSAFQGTLSANNGVLTLTGTTNAGCVLVCPKIDFVSGQKYTMSMEIRSDNITNCSYNYIIASSNESIGGSFSVSTQWKKVSMTFTPNISQNGGVGPGFTSSGNAGKSIQIRHFKLELGSKATDWTPAPEDIDNELDSKANKATSLSGYGITDGVNAVSVTGNGNAVTTASVKGHTLTLTKGASYAASSHTHTGANITGLTASRALASDASGHVTVSAVTATELGYLDGVTSSIQTQLNNKAGKSTSLSGYGIADGVNAVSVTGNGNAITTASVSGHTLTLNKGTSFAASSHTHTGANITGLTASRALTSDANGHVTVSAVTSTELGYLDGVTSNIQTQLNGKAASSHTHTVSQITDLTNTLSNYAKKSEIPAKYVLPTASSTTLGGIKIGNGIKIDSSGVATAVGQVVANSGEIFNDYTSNKATGLRSHAEGGGTTASGHYSHAEGSSTTASGDYSHSEGELTTASGRYSHAEGNCTTTQNDYEHAQGQYNKSNTGTSDSQKTIHSIGIGIASVKKNAVEVMANGDVYVNGIGGYNGTNYSSAKTLQESVTSGGGVGKVDANSNGTGEIFNDYVNNNAIGNYSHAEGNSTTASGSYSHAEGCNTEANGSYGSHAEGYITTASGSKSHAEGDRTKAAAYCQHVQGQFNTTVSSESSTTYSATTRAFIIGNGSSTSSRGNAFYVLFNGATHADGAYSGSGADYAEMFEWSDGNTNKEDRVGYFVALDNDKIRIANSDDNYILGIVSGSPMVIGNNPMRWQGKYLDDEWGRPVYENIEYDEQVPMTPDDEGYDPESKEPQMKIVKRQAYVRKQNPEWNGTQEYSLRTNRDEWACVGLMGQLLVRQDGTLKAGGFCKVSESGIATNSDSGYYVMKVNSDSQALVMFK